MRNSYIREKDVFVTKRMNVLHKKKYIILTELGDVLGNITAIENRTIKC